MLPEAKVVSKNMVYCVFLGLAAILMIMGIIFSPSFSLMLDGYYIFLTHSNLIDFDGLQQAGHFGTAFLNAGFLLSLTLLVYKLTDTEIEGVQIAAAMMMMGFSFYGKNILNICFPFSGVLLHTCIRRRPLKSATALAFFSTALSPVFSVLAFHTEVLVPRSPLAYTVGASMGILSGIIVSVIASEYLPKLHQGYILFNAGFADGVAGMFMHSFQKAIGIGHERFIYVEAAQAFQNGVRSDYVSGQNGILGAMLAIIFGYLIIVGIALGGMSQFRKIIWLRCKGGNFVQNYGIAACLINMGFIGLVSTVYVFLTLRGQLGGPIFAAICTAAGFAASGVTLRNFLPTMTGVFLTATITGGITGMIEGLGFIEGAITKVSARGMILAAIFSCGLAPIAGVHGAVAGLFVGMAHCLLVPNTAVLHGWMSLYNNGLSLSLVSIFMHPFYSKLHINDKRPLDDD